MQPSMLRFGLRSGLLVLGVSVASLVLFAGETNTPPTPRDDVEAAYARLAATPHRKRETIAGPMATLGGVKPVETDVVAGRTRLVHEIEVPRFGRMRTELVTVNGRSAARTEAPEIVALIEKTRARATVQSVRSLLNQLLSVAAAVQTGGLSSSQMIQQAISAAATMKSAADARRVLDQAAAAFNSWQPVPAGADDEFATFSPDAFPSDVTFVGTADTRRGLAHKFVRRPAGTMAGVPAIVETLWIDAKTGLPLIEETSLDGQLMMRVEYCDFNDAGLVIEVPECLR